MVENSSKTEGPIGTVVGVNGSDVKIKPDANLDKNKIPTVEGIIVLKYITSKGMELEVGT